jgi:4-diphosphocytidyl-2-C-methyl-D-erythritol kinase
VIQSDKPDEHLDNGLRFTTSGTTIDGDPGSNLCVKAFTLLRKDFPDLPPTLMHLHKVIPMGAGLGGGSADGAFMLKLLNEKYQLKLSVEQLLDYALQLGSDCPFFIINKPCLATGRGEILSAIHLDLSQYHFVLINPGLHINTGWAFQQINPSPPARQISDVILQPINTWKEDLKNDFELPVLNQYTEIKSIKDDLYKAGANYAAMTGTGSTIFAIFSQKPVALPKFPEHYMIKNVL